MKFVSVSSSCRLMSYSSPSSWKSAITRPDDVEKMSSSPLCNASPAVSESSMTRNSMRSRYGSWLPAASVIQ